MVRASQEEVTRLLNSMKEGHSEVSALLFQYVWKELHRIAGGMMGRERPGHTLQTTALINEAYLRLAGPGPDSWKNRAQFFAVAAMTMRRILVDHARKRKSLKCGRNPIKVQLDEVELIAPDDPVLCEAIQVLELDAALNKLREIDPRQATIVEMRYFTGMTVSEVAKALDLPEKKVKREWKHAKTWLYDALTTRKTT